MDVPQPALALAKLVEQYYADVYRFAYRLAGSVADAEDLTQQAFLAAHEHLGELRAVERARSWLFVIVKNQFLKLQQRNRVPAFADLADWPDPSTGSGEDSPLDGERLHVALQELPVEYRLPLVMFYFGEMGYKEIAEELGIPIGTVMSRLSRGKSVLRQRLAPVFSQ